MHMLLSLTAFAALAGWLWLLLLRGNFWRISVEAQAPAPEIWPSLAVIVPARNEEATVSACIQSLIDQDYPGQWRVIVVDDHSSDFTAQRAETAAAGQQRIQIIQAEDLPPGWSGKIWALENGLRALAKAGAKPDYVLLTDADIQHGSANLRNLVARAELGRYDLVSQMVKLSCVTAAEKLMVPAFIFFFRMLYPFAWVNDPDAYTAAGAGGVMLLRSAALEKIGGLESIKNALIDDCALASLIKQEGPIHLSLSEETKSLRLYHHLSDLWAMIARTAFKQLNHSWGLLILTILAMGMVFVAPPLLILVADKAIALAGLFAWSLSALAYAPVLRFYGVSGLRAWTLPLTALIYLAATIDSARRYALGRGGLWKGRLQDKTP